MQSKVEAPCPQCAKDDALTMLAMNSEIPYFGEHTQITVLCSYCGWKHTDFIPADGKIPGFSSLIVDNSEKATARVVRSSSCTIRIPELDLEVTPGSSSSGYVTNIEGVLSRFENAIETIIRGADTDDSEIGAQILEKLRGAREGIVMITVQLLDPRGRSQIIHHDAKNRELRDDEEDGLEIGTEIPVFEIN